MSGGNCLKHLKGGGTEQRGGDTKTLKKGGQAGSRGGALKGVCVARTPLQTVGLEDALSMHYTSTKYCK